MKEDAVVKEKEEEHTHTNRENRWWDRREEKSVRLLAARELRAPPMSGGIIRLDGAASL